MQLTDHVYGGPTRRALVLGGIASLASCRDVEPNLLESTLAPIAGLKHSSGRDVPGVDTRRFAGRVTLLNIWASWCPICRGEHDMLKILAVDPRYLMAGLVFRDNGDNARAYLESSGNPYDELSVDHDGRLAAGLGVRGVPYTFVFDRARKPLARVIGGLNAQIIAAVIEPAVARAIAPPAT